MDVYSQRHRASTFSIADNRERSSSLDWFSGIAVGESVLPPCSATSSASSSFDLPASCSTSASSLFFLPSMPLLSSTFAPLCPSSSAEKMSPDENADVDAFASAITTPEDSFSIVSPDGDASRGNSSPDSNSIGDNEDLSLAQHLLTLSSMGGGANVRPRSVSMSMLENSSSSFRNGDDSLNDNGERAMDYLGAGNSFNSALMKDRKHYIGIYSPQARKIRIKKFIEKRKYRMWSKKVKYDVRKSFADSRVRVKGRFVKKSEDPTAGGGGSTTTTTTSSFSANKKQ